MSYTTLADLVDQEIVGALDGVHPDFDLADFVAELRRLDLIVFHTTRGWGLITDDEGNPPGFWPLVEKHDLADES